MKNDSTQCKTDPSTGSEAEFDSVRVGPRATASGDDLDFAILRPFDVDRDTSFRRIEVTGDRFLELADGGGDLEDGIGKLLAFGLAYFDFGFGGKTQNEAVSTGPLLPRREVDRDAVCFCSTLWSKNSNELK